MRNVFEHLFYHYVSIQFGIYHTVLILLSLIYVIFSNLCKIYKEDVKCKMAGTNLRGSDKSTAVSSLSNHFMDNRDVPHCITGFLMFSVYGNGYCTYLSETTPHKEERQIYFSKIPLASYSVTR